jgi:hypothetical protein
MRLTDFQSLVDRLRSQVPAEYLGGVVEIAVSPKALPHPVRAEIYTLGECIPLEWTGSGADLQSRVVLYYGSFAALAGLSDPGEFDWRKETWDTLTHELRHHIEWRANTTALETYDWAAEQNFARHEGDPFDPTFYREGERVAPGIYKVDDDVFVELRAAVAGRPLELTWHGRRYQAAVPSDVGAPAFLTLDGLAEPPPGDAVAVWPRRLSLGWLFRRRPVRRETIVVKPVDA